jgi:hypothetical protein
MALNIFGQVLLAKQRFIISDFWIENWSLKICHWSFWIGTHAEYDKLVKQAA